MCCGAPGGNRLLGLVSASEFAGCEASSLYNVMALALKDSRLASSPRDDSGLIVAIPGVSLLI